ncbi:MAG: DUF based on E rectale Gene description [Lachnoclostridium sp.]|jgi:hypothetical protein
MTDNKGFIDLEENIETTIYEGLLKLGFEKNDSFSIYYDLDLLSYLLGVTFATEEECLKYLQNFIIFVKDRLPDIKISLEGKRFKFTVMEDGIAYIYKKNKDNHFLKELIETVKTHSFNLDDILKIFGKYSKEYVCEEINNSEFQYVIYFKDSTLDKFKYCFTFDQMGGYYHRLLDFSYNKIMQE